MNKEYLRSLNRIKDNMDFIKDLIQKNKNPNNSIMRIF